MRPTPALTSLQAVARRADVAMDPGELGSARITRHSFARALTRHVAQQGWKVSRRLWEMDGLGRGVAIYRVDMGTVVVEQIAFSQVISEEMRTDRVIAQAWDVTGALVDGEISNDHRALLERHVTKQEDGRADERTFIWGRANRSQRFFDYVVDCLASGLQPRAEEVSDAAYILRSTAFYGNGKWGLRDFDGIPSGHPLSVPYRAQMLSAWLLREFSADLAEHCARAKSPDAVPLHNAWRQFLGLGNATGLGMVPYPIRHPQVLDAWVALRELPLAHALTQAWSPSSRQWATTCDLLEQAQRYFSQKKSFTTDPYPTGQEIAEGMSDVIATAREYQREGTMKGSAVNNPSAEIHRWAQAQSREVRQVVDSVLVEIESSLDDEMEKLLHCVDRTSLDPTMTLDVVRTLAEEQYSWAFDFDFQRSDQTRNFWFYSRNNQEPRRGVRGKDKGLITEHPVGIASDVVSLMKDVRSNSSHLTVGEFLGDHPKHWGIVERLQSVAAFPYSEARINPLAEDFLPLDLQRFQLAVYGMENFNPQSTDWLRVTLFGGAPTVADIEAGHNGDGWLFVPRPESVE